MHDNNLDDLIINDIEPKNSKVKNFLTIIALMIVVLIIAIILTKIVLKDPKKSPIKTVDTHTQFISSKLTPQTKPKQPSKDNTPSVIVEEETPTAMPIEKTPVEKNSDDAEDKELALQEKIEKQQAFKKRQAREREEKRAREQALEKEKQIAKEKEIAKQKELSKQKRIAELKRISEQKRVADEKRKAAQKIAAQKVKTLPVTQGNYYVQVGSFSQAPSSLFISVIQKSGFHYKITSPSSKGIKKLLIGPYKDRASAASVLPSIKDRIQKQAFIIKR